jgi:uncharacterized membrane protein
MKEVYNKYLNSELKLEKWQIIGIICLIIVISGLFGWIYEYIFYFFNGGMKKFYWRGGNFLPWINIYSIGALIILITTRKLKKHPLLIFLISVLSTGILEYFSGYVIYEYFGGLRFWDYNTEILNFGNIGGYVCLRSVGFFGLSSLILMYVIVPICIFISKKMNKKTFLILSITLCSVVLFDEYYNLIFARILNTPRAHDVYAKIGFNFMNYK